MLFLIEQPKTLPQDLQPTEQDAARCLTEKLRLRWTYGIKDDQSKWSKESKQSNVKKEQRIFNVVQLDFSSLHPREGKEHNFIDFLKMNYRVKCLAAKKDHN